MPASAYWPMMLRSSAMEWLTAVRWATGVSVVSETICWVSLTVPARVEPPAPYVTETKSGATASTLLSAFHRFRSPLGVFGAENSKEYVVLPDASMSRTVRARSVLVDAVPRAIPAG